MTMTKHKNAQMIKAKADNVELVIFKYSGVYGKWIVSNFVDLVDDPEHQYFLCLPEHESPCLHWLNGGEAQRVVVDGTGLINLGSVTSWEEGHLFMNPSAVIRIKPRKEKRWIVYRNGTVYGEFLSTDEIHDDFKSTGQLIEIEIEVEA